MYSAPGRVLDIQPIKRIEEAVGDNMQTKEQLIREIQELPEDLAAEVYDFVVFIQKRRETGEKKPGSWGHFALSTGAFDFWNDPREVEYSLENIKRA